MASMVFRDSDVYRKKLMRLSAAMRRYHEFHLKNDGVSHAALSREAEDLEELSLSAYSLMKVIKKNLADAAQSKLILPGVKKDGAACSIIKPHGWPDGEEEENR